MGGNGSSHLSEEDGGGITFVRGIRLSDRVIHRMKPSSDGPHIQPESQTPAAAPLPAQSVQHFLTPPLSPPPSTLPPPLPPQEARPTPPSVEPPPPPVKFHSLESAEPQPAPLVSAPPSSPPSPQMETPVVPPSVPSPPHVKPEVLPAAESFIPAHAEPETPTTPQTSGQTNKPLKVEPSPTAPLCQLMSTFDPAAAAPHESAASSRPPAEPGIPSFPAGSAPKTEATLVEPVDSAPPPELAAAADLSTDAAASRQSEKLPVVPADGPVTDPAAEEPTITCSPPAAALPVCPESVEEELRQKIKVEMQRSLEEEINQKRKKLQQQLEEVRAQAQAERQVGRTQEAETAAYAEELKASIQKEKMKAEHEKLMVQLHAQQLEEKEKEMKKRDVLHKEHAAKLEAKLSKFYKVSAENFQKGKEETHKRFTRFNSQPVCADLQGQILKCYKENAGRTLSCSGIASAYMQCVDNAKKVQIQT